MTQWEYTYLWWEGSTTNAQLGQTTPPIGEEIIDKLNTLGAEGWEIDHITAAPSPPDGSAPEAAPPPPATPQPSPLPGHLQTGGEARLISGFREDVGLEDTPFACEGVAVRGAKKRGAHKGPNQLFTMNAITNEKNSQEAG